MSPPEAGQPGAATATAPALNSALTDSARDTLQAIRNALQLGASLMLTWGVALAVQLVLPRFLGPARFGDLSFADAFSTTGFVLLTFGVETYIRKEVPNRPEHASEFFGGLIAARIASTILVLGIMTFVLHQTGRSPEVQWTVFAFSAAQFFVLTNGTLSAFLHARGTVTGLSVANVASKVLWGAGLAGALWFRLPLAAIALSLAFAEAVKAAWLFVLCRRNLGLTLQLDRKATWAMLVASAPFFVTLVSHTLYSKVDVSLLAFLTRPTEVGWYGAAASIAELSLLLTPLIGWVLMPLMSRAAARSKDELLALTRRAMEAVLAISIPVALGMGLGADVWMTLLFGSAFEPAAISLRILAPMFVFTYLAVIASNSLILLERSWTVTVITVACVAVNLALNFALIRPLDAWIGPSGGGAGSALAQLLTEVVATFALLFLLGRQAFAQGAATRMARLVLSAAAAIGAHVVLRPFGPWAVFADVAVYVVVAVATGGVQVQQLKQFVELARAGRRQERAEAER